ncbi:MAG: hypothetical protein JSS50_05425 [Proteobacteria bacterium]|nr:hypothetical protein [Pseudomonadota bacterium]
MQNHAQLFISASLDNVWHAILRDVMGKMAQEQSSVELDAAIKTTNKKFKMAVETLFSDSLSPYFQQVEYHDLQDAIKMRGFDKRHIDRLVALTAKQPGLTLAEYAYKAPDIEFSINYIDAKHKVTAMRCIGSIKEETWLKCFEVTAKKMKLPPETFNGPELLAATDAAYQEAMLQLTAGQPSMVQYSLEEILELLDVAALNQNELYDISSLNGRQRCILAVSPLIPPKTATLLNIDDYEVNVDMAITPLLRMSTTHSENTNNLFDQYITEFNSLVETVQISQNQPSQLAEVSVAVSSYTPPVLLDYQAGLSMLKDEVRSMLQGTVLSRSQQDSVIEQFNIAEYNKKAMQDELIQTEIQQNYIILSMLNGISDPSQRLAIFQEAHSKNGVRIRLQPDNPRDTDLDKAVELRDWLNSINNSATMHKDNNKLISTSIVVTGNIQDGYVAHIKIRTDGLLERILRAIVSFLSKSINEDNQPQHPVGKFIDKAKESIISRLDPLRNASQGDEKTTPAVMREARTDALTTLHDLKEKTHERKDFIREIIEKHKNKGTEKHQRDTEVYRH